MFTQTIRTLTGKLKITIPTQLNELQLGQLMAMQAQAHLSDLDAIHILSGVPLTDLQQIRNLADLQDFNEHVLSLANNIKYLYDSEDIPPYVNLLINNSLVKVKVNKNLSIEPAGAFMAARDIIADEISTHITKHGEADWQEHFNPSLEACCQILAHYFYSRATKQPYDEHQATSFAKNIEQLPVSEALPIAKYFFLNYPNLSKTKTSFWHRLLRVWNKRQALKSSKSSGISIQ